MRIIEVHAEVFAVSPVFVTRVTQKVIEAVSEELTRLVQCVTEHGPYSPIQVGHTPTQVGHTQGPTIPYKLVILKAQVGHTQGLIISYRLVTLKALQTYTLIGHTQGLSILYR